MNLKALLVLTTNKAEQRMISEIVYQKKISPRKNSFKVNPKFFRAVSRLAGEAWGWLLMVSTYGGVSDQMENNYSSKIDEMLTPSPLSSKKLGRKKIDYSVRDKEGKVGFYVLLWKRKGITLELFDNYWKDVHGPVCARLPGQYQYWQFHVAHNEGGIWAVPGDAINASNADEHFDGIAELSFVSELDRETWFKAAAILMDDEHNIFSKAIGYNTSPGNSITFIDGIENGAPNGETGVEKYHCLIRKADGVSVEEFRKYIKEQFAPALASSERVVKLRLHLFEEVDNSRPDAGGVSHYEPPEKQYHAAVEIGFWSHLERELLLASEEYLEAVKDFPKYVKDFKPFPERTAYTFVYQGEMTLAGERSAKVAELIMKIGAENQLKEEIKSVMLKGSKVANGKAEIEPVFTNGKAEKEIVNSSEKIGLGHLLQGVQHFGVTVDDLEKSLEFYLEVLGGKLVVTEKELVGDVIQNTLFQKEELDAIAAGIEPVDLPRLRSTKEDGLDVNFISFGNTVVELIYFREAGKPNAPRSSVRKIPSHIGHVNAMHMSFNVKEGIDLNVFANMLEKECHRRGMTEVICNRVIHVKSEAERRAVALKYNSFKFWNEPNGEEPEIDWSKDPMEGWSLFYCKGPNGEQLEFNQVTRKVKNSFRQAMEEYNRANETTFTFPDNKIANGSQTNGKINQGKNQLEVTFSSEVNANWETVWEVLKDQTLNPQKHNPKAKSPKILAEYSDGMLREMSALGMTIKEKLKIEQAAGKITHILVENQLFSGTVVSEVINQKANQKPIISYNLNWQTLNEEGQKQAENIEDQLQKAIQHAVLKVKETAEKQDSQTIQKIIPMQEKLPGTNTDLVKRLFSRGEAFDSEGFITFFTDKPLYQFGNFDVCLDKESIKKSADNFFSQIDAVYHEIKMMWELGDVVFVEMDVFYWRKDGSMVSLPCFDIFRVEGDKFSELRIFMDVNPVFDPKIPVPEKASVLTFSEGKKLMPPGTMKKHFAQHPEAQERIKLGYGPKWAESGPKWPISDSEDDVSQSEQLEAVVELSQNIMAENWDKVKTFLTDDIFYKVGSGKEVYGPDAVVNFFKQTFKNIAKFTGHQPRKIWTEPGIITIEMNAYYEMVPSKKQVTIACCDIYRMRGKKVSEWRVYADMSPWQEN